MNMTKKTFKNRFYKIAFCFIAVLLLVACSNDKEIKEPEISEIEDNIHAAIDFANMEKGDEEFLQKFYDIDSDKLIDFTLYIPKTNLQASETLILKVKDSDELEDIHKKIENRVESQKISFENYLPEEYFLMEKYILKSKGDYLLYSVSEDVDTIEKIFDQSF